MCSQIPSLCLVLCESFLQLTTVDNGGTLLVLDSTTAGAGSLKSLDNVHGLLVSDLAENDVAAVEPRGDNSGDEELRAVGVGSGVGHGQQTGAVVGELEVLVGELLTIDGFSTSAITTGEVTTLEHEVGDDSVERRALVAEALLTSAESTEVLSGLGDLLVVEGEVDATTLVLNVTGRFAVLEDGALPLNVEENLVTHDCG